MQRGLITMKYVLLVVFVTCAAGVFLYWRRMSPGETKATAPRITPKDELDPRGLKITTASESDERAARLLPTKGSEDVSSLLVRPQLPSDGERNYGPQEAVQWVIDIAAAPDGAFKRGQVLGVFDRDWREQNGQLAIYGRAAADKKWSFIDPADAPDEYDQLALGLDLVSLWAVARPEPRLNEIAQAAETAAKRLGAAGTTLRLPVKTAVARSRELEALRRELEDARAVVLLAAPEGKSFDGNAIWDVMMCLGLRWGDMDLFHWENEAHSPGDDQLFSVSSGTAPGYFLPEEIAAGRLHVGNLVFDFSIPRSADPKVVLEAMLAAATYAQKRLGGELVDDDGDDLNPDVLRNHVADVVARLSRAGPLPGHEATLRLF